MRGFGLLEELNAEIVSAVFSFLCSVAYSLTRVPQSKKMRIKKQLHHPRKTIRDLDIS